jgi:hypothetical protein
MTLMTDKSVGWFPTVGYIPGDGRFRKYRDDVVSRGIVLFTSTLGNTVRRQVYSSLYRTAPAPATRTARWTSQCSHLPISSRTIPIICTTNYSHRLFLGHHILVASPLDIHCDILETPTSSPPHPMMDQVLWPSYRMNWY